MKRFNEFIREGLTDKMTPKSEEEILKNLSVKEKTQYAQLKEIQHFLNNKWNADFKIDRKTFSASLSRISLSIKSDIFWVVISYIDDDTLEIYYESLIGGTSDSTELKTKEDIVKWVEETIDSDVGDRLYHIREDIKKLETDQAEIETSYKKLKKE